VNVKEIESGPFMSPVSSRGDTKGPDYFLDYFLCRVRVALSIIFFLEKSSSFKWVVNFFTASFIQIQMKLVDFG